MDHATHSDYDGYVMVNPEKANLVVRVTHKGVQTMKAQPVYRLVTEMIPFTGPPVDIEPSLLDEPGVGKVTPSDTGFERLRIPGRPAATPGVSMLLTVGDRQLPTLRSPTITALTSKVDGFEDIFIGEKDKLASRYSKASGKLTIKAPIEQLPIKLNPLHQATSISELPTYEGEAWRTPSGFWHDKGTTAADVIRFEREELGNIDTFSGISDELLDELDQYDADDIIWVARDEATAADYNTGNRTGREAVAGGRGLLARLASRPRFCGRTLNHQRNKTPKRIHTPTTQPTDRECRGISTRTDSARGRHSSHSTWTTPRSAIRRSTSTAGSTATTSMTMCRQSQGS